MRSTNTLKSSKQVESLLDKIVLTKTKKKMLCVVTGRYPVEKRYKDMQKVIESVGDDYRLRDKLYSRLFQILKGKKGMGLDDTEQSEWGWRLMCVFSRYLPPSKQVPINIDAIPSAGNQVVRQYIKRQLNIANGTSPVSYVPSAQEIEWVAMKGAKVLPLFGVSLQDIDPSLKTEVISGKPQVPKVLVMICEAILAWEGSSIEGLFRIPANNNQVESLKHFIEKGDYAVFEKPTGDALAAACVLKFWFRSLPDPVIPAYLYSTAVKETDVQRIFKELPKENQQVLRCLLALIQTITSPSNRAGTRMSVNAMAVVMAPNILRSEAQAVTGLLTGQDLIKSVSAANRAEQEFLVRLIETIK